MKRLSEKAKARKLVAPEIRLAREVVELAASSHAVIMDLVTLIREYEDAAAWKAKSESEIRAKTEGATPGDPIVAGMLLEFEEASKRIDKRRQKHLERLRGDIKSLTVEYEAKLARYEGRI